jgi:hypothetical protein
MQLVGLTQSRRLYLFKNLLTPFLNISVQLSLDNGTCLDCQSAPLTQYLNFFIKKTSTTLHHGPRACAVN